MKTYTKGNVIVEDIKIGDIHYEYQYDRCVKSQVLTLPIKEGDGNWYWNSKNLNSGFNINYGVNPNLQHYSVNLYDYEAYKGAKYV